MRTMKKTVGKKPMIKSTIVKKKATATKRKSLKRYQTEGEVAETTPTQTPPATTPAPVASPKRTYAQAYTDNVNAGMTKGQARRNAQIETGLKEPKRRVDPNAVINAIGNTASAVGSTVSAFRGPQQSMGPGMKKGGVTKAKYGTSMKTGMMKKGGVSKMKTGGATTKTRSISAKAANRKVAKGKGTIDYVYGGKDAPGTGTNKGNYIGFSKESRKSSSPFGVSMKDAKPGRAIKQKGGVAKPKAMYGMSVKPSMMKKGGTKKK